MIKKIFIVLAVIILSHLISAQTANFSNESTPSGIGISTINYINIEIDYNGLTTVEEEVTVNNTIVSIPGPLYINDLLVSDSKNKLKYELLPKDGRQLITFYLLSPMEKTVKIKYNTQHLTSKNGDVWTLKFPALVTPYHTIVNVKFPEGSNITRLKPDIPRYPANLSNPMWLYPQRSEFYLEMDYQTNKVIQPSDTDYLYYIVSITAIILILVVSYILIKKKKSKKVPIDDKKPDNDKNKEVETSDSGIKNVEKEDNSGFLVKKEENKIKEEKNKRKIKDSIIKIIDENEKKILEILENKEDEITQAYVYKTTGIPKSSLSDIMQRLEKRNIIERRKDGRISWIKLKDWVFE